MDKSVLNLMTNHRSVRKFKDEEIPLDVLKDLIRAGQGAPTSHHVQAYSIILVQDKTKREKIAEVARQKQVTDSPVFLVFCADFKRLEYAAKKHGTDFQYDSTENLIVTAIDAALAAQNVLLAAESIGYGGCFVGGIRNNAETVGEVLRVPDKAFPLFGMTLGVPAEDNETKPRLPVEAILHIDEYNESAYDRLLDEFDEQMEQYYSNRSTNNKNVNWTKLMSEYYTTKRRAYMREFLKKKGFLLEK